MSKKKFASPFLILGPIVPGEDDQETGGGSAQSGFKPYPCSFEEWLKMFQGDYKEPKDGVIDWDDYAAWWDLNDFEGSPWSESNDDGSAVTIELYPDL